MRLTNGLAMLLVAFGLIGFVGCGKSDKGAASKAPTTDIGKPEAGSTGPVGGGVDVPKKSEDTGATTTDPKPEEKTTEPAKTEEKKEEPAPAKTEEKKEEPAAPAKAEDKKEEPAKTEGTN